jgi:hypothetical protein
MRHPSVRARLSIALQTTAVDPTGKVDPGGGVQFTVTGGSPPVAVGTW